MKQGPRLELRQGQSLVMTQQLQQSIKLLQCNALELREFVEAELEKNPFLQQEDGEGEQGAEASEPPPENARNDDEPREADFEGDDHFASDMDSGNDWGDDGGDSRDIERDYLSSVQSASSRSSASASEPSKRFLGSAHHARGAATTD